MKKNLLVLLLSISLAGYSQVKVPRTFINNTLGVSTWNNVINNLKNNNIDYDLYNNNRLIMAHDVNFGGRNYNNTNFYFTKTNVLYKVLFYNGYKSKEDAANNFSKLLLTLRQRYTLNKMADICYLYNDNKTGLQIELMDEFSDSGTHYWYVKLWYWDNNLYLKTNDSEVNEM